MKLWQVLYTLDNKEWRVSTKLLVLLFCYIFRLLSHTLIQIQSLFISEIVGLDKLEIMAYPSVIIIVIWKANEGAKTG